MKISLLLFFCSITLVAEAQQPDIQFFRSYNKTGINVFEPTKVDTTLFTGMKVRIGGNFT